MSEIDEIYKERRRSLGKLWFIDTSMALNITTWFWVRTKTFSDYNLAMAFMPMQILLLLVTILITLSLFKPTKPLQIVAIVVHILLTPVWIISALSQTKPLASTTLPFFAFGLVIVASTGLFYLLTFLHLGSDFDNKVIPYLNLTTILTVLSYYDKKLVRLAARYTPDDQMPQVYKDWNYQLADKRLPLKLSYLFLTVLVVLATVERLYGKMILNILPEYKEVVLQSLLTFIAIDRLIGKWKTK